MCNVIIFKFCFVYTVCFDKGQYLYYKMTEFIKDIGIDFDSQKIYVQIKFWWKLRSLAPVR